MRAGLVLGSVVVVLLCTAVQTASVQAQQSQLVLGAFPAEGIGLVAWDGTVEDLAAGASAHGCALESVWATVGGQFVGYTVGAPDFVNADFLERVGARLRPSRILLVSCAEGGVTVPPAATPTGSPTPTATPTSTSTLTPTPAAPLSTTPLYNPFGADVACADFPTQADAQILFEAAGGPAVDLHGLDLDGDGIACEELP